MSRDAMQQALEALMMMRDEYEEYACPGYACPACDHADAAITTLRKALAEPEQEPVPWEQFYPDIGKPQTTHWEGCEAVHPECKEKNT